MILTLTMNPAVDIGYTVETLKMDTVNRTQKVSKTPGGKGLNVSRVLKQLGSPVLATGLLGGHIGAFIKEKLDEVALENNFYPIQSETRNCIAILHEGLQTEILEAGPTITPEEQAGFLAHFETLLKEVNLISENFSPTSDEVTYTPTHDTNNITVGEMIARLESTPASDFALLGFSPKKAWNHDIYNRVGSIREIYLNELKSINIKELISYSEN